MNMGHEMLSAEDWTSSALDSICKHLLGLTEIQVSNHTSPRFLQQNFQFSAMSKTLFASGDTSLGPLCRKRKTKAGLSSSSEAEGQHCSFQIVSVSEYGKHVSLFKGKMVHYKLTLLKKWYNVGILLLEGHVYLFLKIICLCKQSTSNTYI